MLCLPGRCGLNIVYCVFKTDECCVPKGDGMFEFDAATTRGHVSWERGGGHVSCGRGGLCVR